ncbi:hypothetical protein GFS24_02145 [Chitinophaga sp. SYP-B3965]|uniref:LamG domain-containing protein n=1 Tax=Chitinophaga sp. SYP-B3965 TaxID=2663120 RepID=UPI001299A57F|nr:LamG domain-containing protein [Chitinophaga sp. SYP-B3965]MRG43893.1 hypothetical protein [Chitinophaga sp. SYP-B3965]
MKKILFILLVLFTACKKDETPSALKNDLVSIIASTKELIEKTVEGTELGMTAPGSKVTLQTQVDWANFILQNSGTDTAYSNAKKKLELAITAFNNNKVKAGVPKFANGAYFDLGTLKTLVPDVKSFTIECKVKLTDLNTDGTASLGSFITCDDGTTGILMRYTKAGKVECYVNGGSWFGAGTANNAVQVNVWHHISFTFNGTTIKVYIDGVEAATATSGTVITPKTVETSPFFMGMSRNFQFSSGDQRAMHGNIKDVRFWKVPLTAAEVLNNKDKVLTGTETGIVAYWPFDLNLGLTVKDKTGNFSAAGTNVTWE